MEKELIQQRIQKLRQEIDYHRSQYHIQDISTMAPSVLDSLMHELWLLENEYPEYITPDSPTQRVGGEVLPQFEKVKHQVPMVSLYDVFNQQELVEWEKRNLVFLDVSSSDLDYFLELKLDGLAVSLIYQSNQLQRGVTRGNGQIGENVSHNIRTVQDIPLTIKRDAIQIEASLEAKQAGLAARIIPHLQGEYEIRGEVYMKFSQLEYLNCKLRENNQAEFSNARNIAAGSLRQLDSSVAGARRLSFFAWGLVTEVGQETQQEEYWILEALGFPVVKENRLVNSIKAIQKEYRDLYAQREKFDFGYDGLVIKVNQKVFQQQLGFTGKGPRYMVAYKFPAEEVTTQVLDIISQVGRTGKVTPVAILEPINVYGVQVSRATLHNQVEIERLGLKINDTVIIRRAGDVIPEIVQVLPNLRIGIEYDYIYPTECPECGTKLEQEVGQVQYYCPNRHCPARNLEYLTYAVSADGFNIVGMSKKIVLALRDNQIITSLADIFALSIEDILVLPGFQQKSAEKLFASIQKAKKITFRNFIQALGIPLVGKQTALALSRGFLSLEVFLQATESELQAIADIGPKVAESISDYIHQPIHLEQITALLKLGIEIQYEQSKAGVFRDKKVVITGSFENINRKSLIDYIENQGGQVVSQISTETDLLLLGANPGSKLEKAQQLGIAILGPEEFPSLGIPQKFD